MYKGAQRQQPWEGIDILPTASKADCPDHALSSLANPRIAPLPSRSPPKRPLTPPLTNPKFALSIACGSPSRPSKLQEVESKLRGVDSKPRRATKARGVMILSHHQCPRSSRCDDSVTKSPLKPRRASKARPPDPLQTPCRPPSRPPVVPL
eukprot:1190305-Prorocentrum_minimum.AAC.3